MRSNKLPLWLRWSGLGLGILTLGWLPREDVNTLSLTLLSIVWSAWIAGWLTTRPWFQRARRTVLLGALAGLLTAPLALGLVIFKAGLHAHGFLDYSNHQLAAVLWRTPIWIVVGGLVGWVAGKVISCGNRS